MLNPIVHPLRSTTLGAVLLLFLAACGGAAAPTDTPGGPTNPPGQPTPAPTSTQAPAPTGAPVAIDMCSLLTVEEVSSAYAATEDHTGETLEGAEPTSAESYSYCVYGSDREVTTWINSDPAAAASIFNTMKINDGEAVSGVGDEAYWSTDSFQPGLYFMKGGRGAFISGSEYGPEDPIIQLGVLLASRM